jgi:hypothetical protein
VTLQLCDVISPNENQSALEEEDSFAASSAASLRTVIVAAAAAAAAFRRSVGRQDGQPVCVCDDAAVVVSHGHALRG